MSNVAFLLLAVMLAVVGSVVLWLRTRKPTTVGSSIDSFSREMRALAPDHDITGTTGPTGKAQPPPGFRTIGSAEITVAPPDPDDLAAPDGPTRADGPAGPDRER